MQIVGYDQTLSEDTIYAAFNKVVSSGVNFFDTAEMYGYGVSEQILGSCVKRLSESGKRVLLNKTYFQ
jgi:aryl-alcohol dehydrogenase-like predicted oxidoreductase